MKPSARILRTNRRERGGRQIDFGTVALTAAAWLLTLFASLRRHREPKKVQERLSTIEDRRYREWARGEAQG